MSRVKQRIRRARLGPSQSKNLGSSRKSGMAFDEALESLESGSEEGSTGAVGLWRTDHSAVDSRVDGFKKRSRPHACPQLRKPARSPQGPQPRLRKNGGFVV